jgi:hypothetical protein
MWSSRNANALELTREIEMDRECALLVGYIRIS